MGTQNSDLDSSKLLFFIELRLNLDSSPKDLRLDLGSWSETHEHCTSLTQLIHTRF